MASSKTTTDHDFIRKWAQQRGGRPTVAKGTERRQEGVGVLRFDFGEKEASLEEISWDEFFDTFEKKNLALLYQDETAEGAQSRFFKFVERNSA